MDSHTFQRLDSILRRALAVSEEQREAFLDETCTGESDLQALRRLLRSAHGDDPLIRPGGALRGPLWETAPADVAGSELAAGARVGPYRVMGVLGRGGSATVYLGDRADGQFEQRVALKVLDGVRDTGDLVPRFQQERQILATLDHPYIARLLDGGRTPQGRPYVAMEYVAGEPIDTYCDGHRLSIRDRLKLFRKVLSAVQYAHRNLIIHRDIKPSNILVSSAGDPKLLDFGIAKLLDASTPHAAPETLSVARPMTPEYASPEQIRGEALTTATDTYQLGFVLYALLTGCKPHRFSRGDYAELLHGICHVEPAWPGSALAARHVPAEQATAIAEARSTSLRRLNRELAGDAASVVMMALRKEPAQRYGTAADFAADIEAVLQHRPVSARARSRTYLLRRHIRRHRLGTATAGAIAITVVVAAFAVAGAWRETTRQMREAQRQRDAAVFESQRAELANDFLNTLLLSDGGGDRSLGAVARLELGVEMIEAQYAETNPAFAGRMLVELGRRFRGASDTNRAVAVLERALALGRQIDDRALMATAQCAAAYAESTAFIMDRVPARLQAADRLLVELDTPDPRLSAACLRARARLEQFRSNVPGAVAHLKEAQRLLEASGNDFRMDYTSVLNDLGKMYNGEGRLREALAMAERILATHERFGRGGTVSRLTAMHNVSVTRYRLGEYVAAHEMHQAIARQSGPFEAAEAQPLWFPVSAAEVLIKLRRFEEALETLGDAVARARQSGNLGNWLPRALLAMAESNLGLGRVAGVAETLDETVALLEQNPTLNRDALTSARFLQARLALMGGDAGGAQRLGDELLAIAGYPDGLKAVAGHRALSLAAKLALELDQFERAERYASEALPLAEGIARGPTTSADVGELLLLLARARLALAHGGSVPSLLERAVACLANGFGPEHPTTRRALGMMSPI